jgi:hypothetical protein
MVRNISGLAGSGGCSSGGLHELPDCCGPLCDRSVDGGALAAGGARAIDDQ